MTDENSFTTLRIERVCDGAVMRITLNRPEVRNAIDAQMINELGRVLDQAEKDPQARVLIITGAGERAFAAGADIAQLKVRTRSDALQRINAALFRRIEEHRLPSIAATRGYALGGGCELAMACDLRLASEDAKFGQPEVGLGILPGAGAIQRLPRLVGLGRAKELILSGRIIDASEAERIGLVNRVVSSETLEDAALQLAKTIAHQGELAVQLSKMALNAAGRSHPAFETIDVLSQAICFESDEKQTRMQAFLDRKKEKKGPQS
jgi:enoyl-CoA hydratase/carnithine racemase